MRISRFEDIDSWKEARQLVNEIYSLFTHCRDFSFRDQIQRASVSVMANIAEGFDRGSNREFVQFLVIARGSVAEVKSLTYAALDLRYVDEQAFVNISSRCQTITKLLNGFIRILRTTTKPTPTSNIEH